MSLNTDSYYMLKLYGSDDIDDIWLIKESICGFKAEYDGYIATHYGSISKGGNFQRCHKEACKRVFIPLGKIDGIYPLNPDWKLVAFDFQQTNVDGEDVYNAPDWINDADWFYGDILL